MAQQFYAINIASDTSTVIDFAIPLRKYMILSDVSGVYVSVGGVTIPAKRCKIPASVPLCIDMQSANTGKAVSRLHLYNSNKESVALVCISVIEYGDKTSGDINYFN